MIDEKEMNEMIVEVSAVLCRHKATLVEYIFLLETMKHSILRVVVQEKKT